MDSSPEKSVMTGGGGGGRGGSDSFTSQDGEKGRRGQIAESIKGGDEGSDRGASAPLLHLRH